MSADHHCERCGVAVATFADLLWVAHEPFDEDSTKWAVCAKCDERLDCFCEGEGCAHCGHRTVRRQRHLDRQDRRRAYRRAGQQNPPRYRDPLNGELVAVLYPPAMERLLGLPAPHPTRVRKLHGYRVNLFRTVRLP